MTELSKKIGDMEFDGLVTDLTPHRRGCLRRCRGFWW